MVDFLRVEAGDDDRGLLPFLNADQLIVQGVGLYRFAVDFRSEVHLERVRAVALGRDQNGLLASAGRGGCAVDLHAIQNEVDGLVYATDRGVGEGDIAGVGHCRVECGTDRHSDDRDAEVDRPGISVHVGDTHLDSVGADAQIRGQVYRHAPLVDVPGGFYGIIDADRHATAARGDLVFQGRPVEGDNAIAALGDGLRQPAGRVVHCQRRVVAAGATTTAATRERPQRPGDDFLVCSQVQVPVLDVCAVDLVQDIGLGLLNLLGVLDTGFFQDGDPLVMQAQGLLVVLGRLEQGRNIGLVLRDLILHAGDIVGRFDGVARALFRVDFDLEGLGGQGLVVAGFIDHDLTGGPAPLVQGIAWQRQRDRVVRHGAFFVHSDPVRFPDLGDIVRTGWQRERPAVLCHRDQQHTGRAIALVGLYRIA